MVDYKHNDKLVILVLSFSIPFFMLCQNLTITCTIPLIMDQFHNLSSSDVNFRYKRKNVKELYKLLHKCNEQLQQFSHVNKKALDQYVNFTEQREELQRRQAELNAGDEVLLFLVVLIFLAYVYLEVLKC